MAGQPVMRAYATITGVMGIVGALLIVMLTFRTGEPFLIVTVLWSLASLLAALGLYSAWALTGGKM